MLIIVNIHHDGSSVYISPKKTRPSIRHGTSVVWKFVPGSCGGAWGVRSGGYPVLTTISPWLKKWNTESLPSKTIVTSEISKIQIFYMEASQNSDTPNHPSHQWPQYSIEPHGDLGILHFRTPPYYCHIWNGEDDLSFSMRSARSQTLLIPLLLGHL
jgi:hypothetical protein